MTDVAKKSAWGVWLLWGLTIIVLIVVIWIYTKVEDCCEGGGPGRGPVIIVESSGGSGSSVATTWKMGSSAATAAAITSWGAPGQYQLREDVYGMTEMFVAADKATPTTDFPVTKATLVINTGGSTLHTLVLERTTANEISWTLDGNPLIACDFSSSAAPPNCTGTGVPPEINGTITSLTTEPPTSTPGSGVVTTVASVKLQAKQ